MFCRKIYFFLIYIVFSVATLDIDAQDIVFSNTIDNLPYKNPSMVWYYQDPITALSYRNQYPSVYQNYGVSSFFPVQKLNSNFGAIVYRDSQNEGVFSHTSIALNYSYRIQIARDIGLAAGLTGAYNFYKVNYSQLQFESGSSSYVDVSNNFPDFSVGLTAIIYNSSYIGISSQHVFEPSINSSQSLVRSYILTFSGNYKIRKYGAENYMQPYFSVLHQGVDNQIMYGGRLIYNKVIGGLFFRQTPKFKFNSSAILLGISFGKYQFVYCYDINLSGKLIFNPKMAAHEVTFLINYKYKGRRNRRGAIKCPNI